MSRTDAEVIAELKGLYRENFGGKENQRFLIMWSDLRSLYGFRKLFETRFARLAELAADANLYLWDLGEGETGRWIAVVRAKTADRWRRVPKKIMLTHKAPVVEDDEADADEDD
jgi:hypothetical protein